MIPAKRSIEDSNTEWAKGSSLYQFGSILTLNVMTNGAQAFWRKKRGGTALKREGNVERVNKVRGRTDDTSSFSGTTHRVKILAQRRK